MNFNLYGAVKTARKENIMLVKIDYGFISDKSVVVNGKRYKTLKNCWTIHIFGKEVSDKRDYFLYGYEPIEEEVEFCFDICDENNKYTDAYKWLYGKFKNTPSLSSCKTFEECLHEISGEILELNDSFRYDRDDVNKQGYYWQGWNYKEQYESVRFGGKETTKYQVYIENDFGNDMLIISFDRYIDALMYVYDKDFYYTDSQGYEYRLKIRSVIVKE